MRKPFQLCLDGYGYLTSFSRRCDDDKEAILISVAALYRPDLKIDDIALFCRVDAPLFSLVQQLVDKRREGHEILMSFRASYSHFGHFYEGGFAGDNYTLILHGELLSIEGWFEDDDWFLSES